MFGALSVLALPPVAVGVAHIAMSSTPTVDVTSLIGTVITPVIVVLLMLFGKLHPEAVVARLEDDITELRRQIADKDEQLAALHGGIVDKVIPALTRATLVLENVSPLLQTEVHLRQPRRDE